MKIIREEVDVLGRVKKRAYSLGGNALLTSRPQKAKVFLSDIKGRILRTKDTYKKLLFQVKSLKHLTHEVENLFDNYYIVDSAISDITNCSVDRGFKRLVLVERRVGVFIPRIYYILAEYLKITKYKIDRHTLYSFLQAYQTKAHLSIRELSFVPFFLRIILVENVQRVMYESITSLDEFKDAEYWFDEIVKKKKSSKENDFSKLTSDLTHKYGIIPINLGFNLLQKLSQYGPDTRPLVKWLKLNLLKQGINISDLAEIENRRQSDISNQISNIINSLRWINQVRWDDFVVDVNIVDLFLFKDPAEVYMNLDQSSQNVYRNEVVKIGDRSGVQESEVAKFVLSLCQRTETSGEEAVSYRNHVGYYLVGAGRDELEKTIGYRKPIFEKIQAFILKRPTVIYLGIIMFFDVILTIGLTLLFSIGSGYTYSSYILLGLLFVLNCELAINLVNIIIGFLIPVRTLFRLDLTSGVSNAQSTFVVIPAMFRDKKSTQELLRRLEVNYLGNSEDNVFFALLMDFRDAKMETTVSDQELCDQVNQGIKKLNDKYPAIVKKFYLFHRRRIWNPHENVFMGWERKRGKLREFNLLLKKGRPTSYFEGLPEDLPDIKYVLTIDEDTRLPKDSAIKLIGCIDHPLNRPVVDIVSGKVTHGYGIIQPKMTTKFSQAKATIFSRIFSSAIGIDSYTGPAADVYQDLFGNSIFYGKGIYDVDTMEKTIGDRIPENQVLSHDLLEGLYTKVGFATDIFLFEGFPESYKEFILRMHRWIRGDWQIISWLKHSSSKNNNFNLSDKWKILDNLRRSVLPIFAVFYLLAFYLFLPDHYFFSLFFILFVLGSSFVISNLISVFDWPKEMTLLMKINNIINNLDSLIIQIIYRFIFLLDQAVISFRAVIVSLYRMHISHKNMLCWQNSHEVSKGLKGTMREFLYIMAPTSIIALLLLFLTPNYHEGFLVYSTLIFWFISPIVAYKISQKTKTRKYKKGEISFLRNIACRSSRFFSELAYRDGNQLIPDHFQEEPVTNSPAATSPTNIGMHMLANFSAFDLGFIGFSSLLNKTSRLFESLTSLERYRGHFYNWYDIRTLQSLNPKYVSSVDSANLLVALLTLKQGILDIIDRPIINDSSLTGLADVLGTLIEDANLIIKDKNISRAEKRVAINMANEARIVLKKYVVGQASQSIDYLTKTFNYLVDANEKIKKIVSNLDLESNKGILSSVYSSAEHFNSLLRQQIDELNTYMSFYQFRRTRPVIRNEKANCLLTKVLQDIFTKLDIVPSVRDLCGKFRQEVESLNFVSLIHSATLNNDEKEDIERWYQQLVKEILVVEARAKKSLLECEHVISLTDSFFIETDFSFLYNKERGLFHIGYNVTFEKIDNSYYDFLASEANAISFIAILKKDVPLKHWFYLGRKLVRLDLKRVLLSSWGGSLFEYLTSLIFFKVHEGSLLGQTAKLSIESHIKHGQRHCVPWGMGESAHATLDLNNNYQYQIFGHPSLGLKRDLNNFLVVAPYTTIMSMDYKPFKAIANLKKLIKNKLLGRYGFYDAVDYSKSLNNKVFNKIGVPTKIYYAHHQGFSLQALNNQINQQRLRSLFALDPRVESLDTLFEEKVPSSIPSRPLKNLTSIKSEYLTTKVDDTEVKQFVPLFTSYPRQAFISNGSYTVNISNGGTGGSKVYDLCLTRYREDVTTEPWGHFIYLQDIVKNTTWSPTTQPVGILGSKNKIEYFENKAKFSKVYNDIESSLTVAVAPDSNAEFRSLTLTNLSKIKKSLNLSSYGEVVLSKPDEDLHHTIFEKLFVKSEYWQKYNAIVYTRRNKVSRGENLYFAHKIVTPFSTKMELKHITDRARFLARGGSVHNPEVLTSNSGKTESVASYNFDPIFSFQNQIELEANETITITYVNIFGNSQEELAKGLRKYSNQKNITQAIKKADKHGYDVINNLGLSREQAINFQALASRLLSPHYSPEVKKLAFDNSEAAVQTLWRLGISGDLPILVVRFYDMNDLALVKNMLQCYQYLKYKGVAFDLVLLNEYPSSYIKSFEDEVDFLIRYNQSSASKVPIGNVFHLRTSHVAAVDKENLISLSKVLIDSKLGTIEQQIQSILQSSIRTPVALLKTTKKITSSGRDVYPDISKLKFFNEFGGFDLEGGEYVMNINYKKSLYPPTVWANIITNESIGSVITENGSMYTWLDDSYDNRLTKRIDDPIADRSSEVFYLRDEETGEFWNPTPLPVRGAHTYTVKHGLGYTEFEHKSRGLEQMMRVFVPPKENIKIVKFKFINTSKVARKLSLTAFYEISFGGANRKHTKDYLETVKDEETGVLIIRNIFAESFKKSLAFIDLAGGNNIITNDREEFLGWGNDTDNPVAMKRERLSNQIYDDVDHCVAQQTFFEIIPGEEKEIIVLLGGSQSTEDIYGLVHKYRDPINCEHSFQQVKANWQECQNKIQIKTPDESLNILFNSRLLYQLISSRLLARTGYSQPSGAYGFRDQLQDSMALVWSQPELTKKIILKASRHQFEEGDAQNWWHEHNSFGVRTTFSDHQLWLPYVASYYAEITGDSDIMDNQEPYMQAPLLDFINNSNWAGVPKVTVKKYDLYDHCLRAIDKTFIFGQHGLPIIGKGDWNDGLNKVGEKGQGESVWLGWFLYYVINNFLPFIKERGDQERVKRYETTAQNLKDALEKSAWDGKWYRRAYFDNGTLLGSRSNKEFKIDSIAQSWSVLSGAAKPERSKQAMESVSKHLFQDDLLLLISPALKDSPIDPGYLKDYPPGVRENGAQYNHAALWAAQAFAKLGDASSLIKVLNSVNPIKRSEDIEKASLYRVEPYAVASDIYAKPAVAGRGGWTWYTGSAGVMYRTILESLLGIKVRANKMEINPCVPKEWTDFSLVYSYKNTKYNIHILNSSGAFGDFPSTKLGSVLSSKPVNDKKIKVDGVTLSGHIINLLDDEKDHEVEVRL